MRRIPYFTKCDYTNIPSVNEGYGNMSLHELAIVAKSIDKSTAASQTHSIPDMLQPDFSLESDMRSNDAEIKKAAFDQWIGFVCAAILLPGENIIKTCYEKDDLLKDHQPLFMQALGRMLETRGIASFTLYSTRVALPTGDQTVAIGYSYQDGEKMHYCPAAYLRADLTDVVHVGCYDRQNKRFQNPSELLKQPGYNSEAMVVAEELNARFTSFPACVQPLVKSFIAVIVDGGEKRVELRPIGGIAQVPSEAQHIAQWFTPRLLVLSGWEKMYQNCYGDLVVQDDAGNILKIKLILPVTKAYAKEVWAMEQDPGATAPMRAAIRDCFDMKHAMVTRYEGMKPDSFRYVLSFTYLGVDYKATYREADCVDAGDNFGVPYTAVWPQRAHPDWKEYFAYYRYPDMAAMEKMRIRPWTIDGDGRETTHAPTFDRTSNDPRNIADECIPLSSFPRFMSVFFDEEEVGLLLPKENITPAVAANPPMVISIDFGSTNTIAYMKGAGAPQPAIIGSSLLHVCGDADEVAIIQDFAPPVPYNKAQFLTMLNTFGSHPNPAADYLIYEESTIPFTDEINMTYDLSKHLFLGLKRNTSANDAVPAIAQSRTRSFMRQIVMEYRWKAVQAGATIGSNPGDVQWRFAYPRSMEARPRQALQNTFQTILPDSQVEFCSEAMAVGQCLTDPAMIGAIGGRGYQAVNGQTGYLIVDIGGGTVDFSLWQNDQEHVPSIRSESSLLGIAGAFAIQETIQHKNIHGASANAALLWEMWSDKVKRGCDTVDKLKESLIKALAGGIGFEENNGRENDGLENDGRENDGLENATLPEQLIAYMEARNDPRVRDTHQEAIDHLFDTTWITNIIAITEQLKTRCLAVSGDNNYPELNGFLQNLEKYFSMLVFYAGEMVGAAIAEKLLAVAENGVFSVVFAGNGSNMLTFLPDFSRGKNAGNARFRQSLLHAHLQTFFLRGLKSRTGISLNVQIIEPLMAKKEVAYGLCATTTVTDVAEVTSNWVKATGEKDIEERANAFAEAWKEIKGEDICQEMRSHAESVIPHIDGKRRDTAFRDLIHRTFQ